MLYCRKLETEGYDSFTPIRRYKVRIATIEKIIIPVSIAFYNE